MARGSSGSPPFDAAGSERPTTGRFPPAEAFDAGSAPTPIHASADVCRAMPVGTSQWSKAAENLGAPPDPPGSKRRFRMAPMSWPVSIGAVLRGSGIRRGTIEVVYISRTGCHALTVCRFACGDFLSLRLPTLGAMGAYVAASDGNLVELCFATHLGASTLELLLKRHRRPGDVRF